MKPRRSTTLSPWRLALWSLPYLQGRGPRQAQAPFWPGLRHLVTYYRLRMRG